MNYKTREKYTQEDVDIYDLPPDVLEQKLHPIYSSRLRRRLAYKAKEAEYNPLDDVYNIPKENLRQNKLDVLRPQYPPLNKQINTDDGLLKLKVIPAQTGVTI